MPIRDLNDPLSYDYALPEGLIAHEPVAERSGSRLLICRGPDRRLGHFDQVIDTLRAGDVLVLNNTKVLPCRLRCAKATGGAVEIFVLKHTGGRTLTVLARTSKRLDPATEVEILGIDGAQVSLDRRLGEGLWSATLLGTHTLDEIMTLTGEMPLPPYILRRRRALGLPRVADSDRQRYQTVYAQHDGAVAAPTAGLHFTEALLDAARDKGVAVVFVTLHVGIGTFRPLGDAPLDQQSLHVERYAIDEETVTAIEACRTGGGRVFAVGTTSARVLEDQGLRGGLAAGSYETQIFIRPGHRWRLVDALITNFHLPKSSLLVMVSSLLGHARTMAAYRAAIEEGFRFYSYGDAMLAFRDN